MQISHDGRLQIIGRKDCETVPPKIEKAMILKKIQSPAKTQRLRRDMKRFFCKTVPFLQAKNHIKKSPIVK